METWNREELYVEVWQKPLVKIAQKYGISAVEKRVQELAGWVDGWIRAKQIREFIPELERVWKGENADLSPDAPKGKRLLG